MHRPLAGLGDPGSRVGRTVHRVLGGSRTGETRVPWFCDSPSYRGYLQTQAVKDVRCPVTRRAHAQIHQTLTTQGFPDLAHGPDIGFETGVLEDP